jgi:transposase-like protein
MPAPRTSKKDAQAAVNALLQYGSQIKAAQALDLTRGSLEARLRAAKLHGIETAGAEEAVSMRQRIKQLESQLKNANESEDIMLQIKAFIGRAKEGIENFDIPEWMVKRKVVKGSHGVPSLFLSDLHWGERVFKSQVGGVNEYDLAEAHKRLKGCYESAVHLLRILDPKMNYPGIVIALGGDMISGSIHDELAQTNDIDSIPAVIDLYGELVNLIDAAAEEFGKVFLPCVGGNHGRNTRKIWHKNRNQTSFDWMLYRFLAKHYEGDKRVQFYIPDGPDARFDIYHVKYLLTHGDKLGNGGDGIIGALGPILRGDQKRRARNAAIDQEYDVLMCGHFHQYTHMTRVIVNGSLKGYDEYAYTNGFGFELPQQALWLTHPKMGITYRMPVYCARLPEQPAKNWVSA